jgi:opacity protein-like surface antigen
MGNAFTSRTVTRLLIALVLPLVSPTSLANNYIEASFGIAWLASENSALDSNTYAPSRIFYGYQMGENVFIETGYLAGDNYDDKKKDDLAVDMFFVALKSAHQINRKYAVYAKTGAVVYQYELKNEDASISKENGLGLIVSAGYEFTLEKSISVGLEYEYLNSVRFNSNTLFANVKYEF